MTLTLADRIVLPGAGLSVSPLCLGGNKLGGDLDQDKSFALLDAFIEAGGNFIDTAHVYADWLPHVERSCSEKTLGRWLKARRPAGVVIATKGGHPIDGRKRLDAASIRQDVTEALTHLGLQRLDLFYVHRDDPSRPVEGILDALESLRAEGLLASYGVSNWRAGRIAEAQAVAARNGWSGAVASQCEWSLARRNPGTASDDLVAMDADLLRLHRQTGLAAISYSAQAKGYFEKRAAGRLDQPTARAYDSEANRAMAARLGDIAAAHAATPTQVMLRAMTLAPFPAIPVIGCRDARQLGQSVAALAVPLDPADAADLLGG